MSSTLSAFFSRSSLKDLRSSASIFLDVAISLKLPNTFEIMFWRRIMKSSMSEDSSMEKSRCTTLYFPKCDMTSGYSETFSPSNSLRFSGWPMSKKQWSMLRFSVFPNLLGRVKRNGPLSKDTMSLIISVLSTNEYFPLAISLKSLTLVGKTRAMRYHGPARI